MLRAAGCARFAYNWGLTEWQRQYNAGEKPSAYKVRKKFNSLKKEEFPWIYDSPKDANQQAFLDLGNAFKNFFESLSGKRKGKKMRYPKLKKKSKSPPKFYIQNDRITFSDKRKAVKLPVIGTVKLHEKLRFSGKILGARCMMRAGRWFLSVNMECEVRVPSTPINETCGIDLNTGSIATSLGEVIDTPRSHRKASAQLRRANRKVARRVKGSNNQAKAIIKLAKVHQRIANIRKDWLDKVTTRFARENQVNVIEDLNVAGMVKCRSLARSVLDAGFGMFRWMMTYKSEKFGSMLIIADRFYPSSKRCSGCGFPKTSLKLSERTYHCEECYLSIDRDLNAALNLEQYPRLAGNCPDMGRTTVESWPLPQGMLPTASQLADTVIRTV